VEGDLLKTSKLVPHPRQVTDLLLVRHGQTDWNVERRIQGWRPVPLNAEGRRQVRGCATLLGQVRPVAIISSPVARTVETADVLKEVAGWDAPVELVPGLGEFRMGDWDGVALSELQGQPSWRDYLDNPAETTFPSGEALVAIRARAVGAVNDLVAARAGGSLVVVSHGGIVRLLLMAAYGLPLSSYHNTHVDNASVTHIRLVPTRPARVMAVNRCAGPLNAL
jgi:broad specificity phosphatase PhoE